MVVELLELDGLAILTHRSQLLFRSNRKRHHKPGFKERIDTFSEKTKFSPTRIIRYFADIDLHLLSTSVQSSNIMEKFAH